MKANIFHRNEMIIRKYFFSRLLYQKYVDNVVDKHINVVEMLEL